MKKSKNNKTRYRKQKKTAVGIMAAAMFSWGIVAIIYFSKPVTTRMNDEKALQYMLSLDKEDIQPYLDSCSNVEAERLIKLMIYNKVLHDADKDSFTVSGNADFTVSDNSFSEK